MSPRETTGRAAALAGWRTVFDRRYRPWHVHFSALVLVNQLCGGAIALPLLLTLGMNPGLATFVGLVPSVGVFAGAFLPRLLARVGGRLRLVVVFGFAVNQLRGIPLAILLGLHVAGVVPASVPLVAISLWTVVGGMVSFQYSVGFAAWSGLVLADAERRTVLPRFSTLQATLTALVLWVLSAAMGVAGGAGLWLYVVCLAAGGIAGFVSLAGLLRIPAPGRVRIPRREEVPVATTASFRRLCLSSSTVAAGGGLQPGLALISLTVLGLPPAFTVFLSAVSATVSLAGSFVAATVIAGLSASRVLRATHVARFAEITAILVAILVPPVAPVALTLCSASEAAVSAVNGIAGAETLYRLAGPAIVAYQGTYTSLTHGSWTLAALFTSSLISAAPVMPVFAALLVAAGITRLAGAALLPVSPTWREGPATTLYGPSLALLAPSAAEG